MSGCLPFDDKKKSIAKRAEEIKNMNRTYSDHYSLSLNYLLDRMLTVNVNDRIKIDEILDFK
jgi:hypothetical protein